AAQKMPPPPKKVPAPAPKSAGAPDDTAGGMLFERDNFDELLKPAVEAKPAPKAAPKPAPQKTFDISDLPDLSPPAPAPAPMIASPAPAKKPPRGILLTPIKIVLLLFFILFMAAGSFVGGM